MGHVTVSAQVKLPRMIRIHLELKRGNGKPYAGCKYRLDVEDTVFEGTTDDAGGIDRMVKESRAPGKVTLAPDPEDPDRTVTFEVELKPVPKK
jgi:hypothetical protein